MHSPARATTQPARPKARRRVRLDGFHQWKAFALCICSIIPDLIYDETVEEVAEGTDADPSALEDELFDCTETEGFVEGGAVVLIFP